MIVESRASISARATRSVRRAWYCVDTAVRTLAICSASRPATSLEVRRSCIPTSTMALLARIPATIQYSSERDEKMGIR